MANPYAYNIGDTTRATCLKCGRWFKLPVTKEQFERWRSGELIQNAMPDLPKEDRELLVSGTCGKCWKEMFGEPEPKETWIQEEMASAVDAGCFESQDDPECRAYAERAYERDDGPRCVACNSCREHVDVLRWLTRTQAVCCEGSRP